MNNYMKSLSLETIAELTRLCGEYRQEEEAEEAKRPGGLDLSKGLMEFLEKGPSQKFLAFYQRLRTLSDDEKNELMALMWIGRCAAGESAEMWSSLVNDARKQDEEGKTEYLAEKPLHRYLPDGLERLGLR